MQAFLSNFSLVATNVGILFLLIAVGFFANKFRIVNENGAKCLSSLALLIVNPCVIINSFIRQFEGALLGRYLLTLLASLAIHAVLAIAAHTLIRDKEDAKERVYRFALVFSNAGYMAIPLQQALLQDEGVFFGSAYIAGFNMVLWSYGVFLMGGKEKINMKKILINPGLIAIMIGMIVFIFSVPVPQILHQAVSKIADLNTPIPMMIIGYYLAEADIIGALKDKKGYYCMFLRLILMPAICIALLWVCGFRSTEFVAMAVAVTTPAAAATTMFSSMYDRDTALSARLVSFSTLLSIITMPILVAVSMLIA